ncbi:MAG TPA: hypothetical protein VE954_13085 [Oligoflexus sp.]|uniref:hypothetical protein n=1 Tax=Oligoflexus sp. TaxID=1971216 RepID=UPI002D5CD051|nr:hypothetical protein [Oligoflexus sp.]HYX34041.1 hypothetical protein [Oligoflexus sp.]
MIRFLKIPALTCSLLLVAAQPSFAQSSSTGSGTGNNSGSAQGTGTGSNTNTNTNQGTPPRTSVGNHSDMSGGTTKTTGKHEHSKTAKSSKDCAANEEFVKQGDRLICIPRGTSDTNRAGSGGTP